MRVGIIGTGAISHKHAQAYRNIGFEVVACSGIDPARGRAVRRGVQTARYSSAGRIYAGTRKSISSTFARFPDFRLEPMELCAIAKKHVQVQKPIATNLEPREGMVETAHAAGFVLERGQPASLRRLQPVSEARDRARAAGQDSASRCVREMVPVGGILFAPDQRKLEVEGGGALINQAIHQVDILLWLAGPVESVSGEWQLGALHKIESGGRSSVGDALRERARRA